jgi:DUF1680 family protein
MGTGIRFSLGVAFVVLLSLAAGAREHHRTVHVHAKVPDRAEARFTPAPLDAQALGGALADRMAVNLQQRLLEGIDLEVLLEGYRQRPGQHAWIGEHIGKFIDAATNTWAYTGDARLKTKLDSAVRELLATQLEDGYLGTYVEADRFIDYGEKGYEPAENLPLWDVWAHKYNMLGLLNYYRRTGFEPALGACRRMADLLIKTYGEGPGQRNIVRNDWHVGMANTSVLEPMAILYRYTGDPRYLEFARYIVRAWDEPKGPKIVTTLLSKGRVNEVANAKAYEMTSIFLGLIELYRATGDDTYWRPVLRAWDDIVRYRLYATGTTSYQELFRNDRLLRADGKVGEGCVTTTWMQLNLRLLEMTGEAKYADELERTIYNALLGAQHPKTGLICYFTPLNGKKEYGAVAHGAAGVNCCTSSVPRGVSLIPLAAWGIRRGGVAVNLFVPGTVRLTLPAGEVTLESKTRFPIEGDVSLTVRVAKPARFPLSIRVPAWSRRVEVTAAGRTFSEPRDGYIEIDRTWNTNDHVTIRMDLTMSVLDGSPTYPDQIAVQRGPQILAADDRLNPGSSPWTSDLWLTGLASATPQLRDADGSLPEKWSGSQAYAVAGYFGNAALGKRPVDLILVPLADAGQTGGEYRVWLQRP